MFSEIEKEVIYLKAVKEITDDAVNFEMLALLGDDPNCNILFKTSTHQKYFNVLLVDFLSCTDKRVLGEQKSYLQALRDICEQPAFNQNNSINALEGATKDFKDWLEQEVEVDVYLASISLERTLTVKRLDFLKLCGDISKHNFLRLSRGVEKLVKILKQSGIEEPDLHVALLVLDDFYERFHIDILNYHSSTIAEFMNNIRWGIYEYLQPEYRRALVQEADSYSYRCPINVQHSYAKSCYWDLMNEVRSVPYLRRFQVTRYLKMRY